MKQSLVAARAGITAPRLSHLENGHRFPSQLERFKLASVLNLEPAPGLAKPPGATRALIDAGRSSLSRRQIHLPPSDRPSRVRYLAAAREWPGLVNGLAAKLRRREDYELLNHFCSMLALDSADECLYHLTRLVQGAKPVLLAPLSLDHLPRRVVCPRTGASVGAHLFPCLVSGDRFEFPQVSLATPRVLRVDCLVFEGGWKCLEIDGPGHRVSADGERQELVGLPIDRLTRSQLLGVANELLPRAA